MDWRRLRTEALEPLLAGQVASWDDAIAWPGFSSLRGAGS